MKYLLRFEDPLATRIEYSGGKGANLSLLCQQGFPVPPGFVITAQGYRDFIHSGRQFLKEIENLPFDDPTGLRDASVHLRTALQQLPLAEDLLNLA